MYTETNKTKIYDSNKEFRSQPNVFVIYPGKQNKHYVL